MADDQKRVAPGGDDNPKAAKHGCEGVRERFAKRMKFVDEIIEWMRSQEVMNAPTVRFSSKEIPARIKNGKWKIKTDVDVSEFEIRSGPPIQTLNMVLQDEFPDPVYITPILSVPLCVVGDITETMDVLKEMFLNYHDDEIGGLFNALEDLSVRAGRLKEVAMDYMNITPTYKWEYTSPYSDNTMTTKLSDELEIAFLLLPTTAEWTTHEVPGFGSIKNRLGKGVLKGAGNIYGEEVIRQPHLKIKDILSETDHQRMQDAVQTFNSILTSNGMTLT